MQPSIQAMPDTISVNNELSLQSLTSEDAPAIADILTRDPEIRQRITWLSQAQDAAQIAQAIAQPEGIVKNYSIKKGDQLIGWAAVSAKPQDPPGTYYVAYFLDPQERGQGIITKTIASLLMTAITKLNPSRFWANIADDNEASQKVIQAFGFERTETVVHDPVLQVQERRWEKVIDE